MKSKEIDHIGKYTALLATTEVGLGSILHAYTVPLAGHFLSLNQSFLLCRSTRTQTLSSQAASSANPFKISMAAASLKSLSPAGKRLTPMLAIAVQGLLFNIGVWLFGPTLIGLTLGSLLLSLWAFAQPVLLYFLIFGKGMIDVADYFLKSLSSVVPITTDVLIYAVVGLITTKSVLAISVAWLAFKKSDGEAEKYFEKLQLARPLKFANSSDRSIAWSEKLRLIAKDMIQPWFIGSIILTALFFYLTNPMSINLVWVLLRPIAVGFILFYTLRFLPINRWILAASNNSKSTIVHGAIQALRYMKEERKT